ncbi:MAG: hypothetical protein BroJett018_46030 [Chloroflexota bacterium]|nr:MAG: hypothetical protein BroJett018_46030 [Chloroflexota bacterium]
MRAKTPLSKNAIPIIVNILGGPDSNMRGETRFMDRYFRKGWPCAIPHMKQGGHGDPPLRNLDHVFPQSEFFRKTLAGYYDV